MKFIFALISFLFFSFVQVNAQTNKGKAHDKGLNIVDEPDAIFYTSDTLKLKGYLCKPKGKGPFPVFMWNHDSEKDPDFIQKFAEYWVEHGYIFFMPIRSGFSDNPGEYICNAEKQINRRREMAQLQFRQIYTLHKNANKDVIAALRWIKQQSYTDTNNIVLAGYGYGGTQVLLTAEKDGNSRLGVKCFFAISPVKGWGKMWGDSLVPALEKAKRPIFLWQAHSEGDLSIMQALGPVLAKKGFPNRSKILQNTPTPAESITNGYYYSHPSVWEKDALRFLKDCGVKAFYQEKK